MNNEQLLRNLNDIQRRDLLPFDAAMAQTKLVLIHFVETAVKQSGAKTTKQLLAFLAQAKQ